MLSSGEGPPLLQRGFLASGGSTMRTVRAACTSAHGRPTARRPRHAQLGAAEVARLLVCRLQNQHCIWLLFVTEDSVSCATQKGIAWV